MRRIAALKTGDEVIGNRTRVKVVKNKLAPPFRNVEFDIRYGTGIDAVGDLLDTGATLGLVEKNGAYFSFEGTSLGQGREKARVSLIESAPLSTRLRAAVAQHGTPLSVSTPASPSEIEALGVAKVDPKADPKGKKAA